MTTKLNARTRCLNEYSEMFGWPGVDKNVDHLAHMNTWGFENWEGWRHTDDALKIPTKHELRTWVAKARLLGFDIRNWDD